MTELQKEFEANGYTSWINADLYPDGKIYTKEYTEWLEKQVLALRQPSVIGSVCDVCGSNDIIEAPHMGKNCNRCHPL
jgi:hypothetical protein